MRQRSLLRAGRGKKRGTVTNYAAGLTYLLVTVTHFFVRLSL
nr:MAG TPA: hypothetical protein [Caudoviricetes sp.]